MFKGIYEEKDKLVISWWRRMQTTGAYLEKNGPPPNLLKENEKGGEKKPWRKE